VGQKFPSETVITDRVKIKPGVEVDSNAMDKLIDAAYIDIKARL
jgi:hypothetical protein